MTKKTNIPKGLKADSAAFYRKILDGYELTDAGLELLKVAAFTLQRWTEARDFLDKNGLIQKGQSMDRLSPVAKTEHDARLSFCRLLKEMNLDAELSATEVNNE